MHVHNARVISTKEINAYQLKSYSLSLVTINIDI